MSTTDSLRMTDAGAQSADVGKEAPAISVVTVVRNNAEMLEETFASLGAQTFRAFEHVVIDGASDDDDATLSVIRRNEDRISLWISEPDEGVYDAINKGIRLSTGRYVAILHAGDTYERDFLERALATAEANRRTNPHSKAVVFASYRHGEKEVHADDPSPGLFLHHLGVNHSTFLVPREVYEHVGLYDPCLRIVSDAIWMRQAWNDGVQFVRVDGHPLIFAPGGLSSAKTPEQRRLVIDEWVASYRRFFPFLSPSIAEALYLYRFDEHKIFEIEEYLRRFDVEKFAHPASQLFLDALQRLFRRIWRDRPTVAGATEASDKAGVVRLALLERLGLTVAEANVALKEGPLSDLLDKASQYKADADEAGAQLTVHYLEVFSRPTETFIPDLIAAMSAQDQCCHVVLCDRRIREQERPYDRLLAFDPAGVASELVRAVSEAVLLRLNPDRFIFHFAVNGWRLLSRVEVRWTETPAIYMTHGIDVFDLPRASPYREFITGAVSFLPNVRFTAVSQYLRDLLVSAGVPEDKVDLVPNAIHERFFQNHSSGVERASRRDPASKDVRLLNIGRLIGWKGQRTIVVALGRLIEQGINARLTIVYGGESTAMADVRAAADEVGVSDRIDYVEWVNFDDEPRYYGDFDVFVSSSTYSSNTPPRSETFGLSVLEAIASGLPVVATSAGGQPEVVGPDREFARIVEPDDPEAMADAILSLVHEGALEKDNIAFAKDRVFEFSRERQVSRLAEITNDVSGSRLRTGLFAMTTEGGAGRAALNVHKSLLKVGVASRFYCRRHGASSEPALSIATSDRWVTDHLQPGDRLARPRHTIFSIDTDGVGEAMLQQIEKEVDVISLHWHARFLSDEDVARLTRSGKPVVFTIRDMHPLAGGCHYFHGCDNWLRDCHPCPQFLPEGLDLPRQVFAWRKANWDMTNVAVVVLSDHVRRIVEQSPLLGGVKIETIPNPIDIEVFRLSDKREAREAFGLPRDKKVIAYLPSTQSLVKGADQFRETLKRLSKRMNSGDVVISMAGRAADFEDCPFQTFHAGKIAENARLAQFYASADVVVAPSLEETFSNTVAEAIACGAPVVGFQTGAIADLADGPRGRTAPIGDTIALTDAIVDVLDWSVTSSELHDYIKSYMTYDAIGARYRDLFEELVEKAKPVRAKRAAVLSEPSAARSLYLAARSGSLAPVSPKFSPDTNQSQPAKSKRPSPPPFLSETVIFKWGWYDVETGPSDAKWRWSSSHALMEVKNSFVGDATLVVDASHLFGDDLSTVEFVLNGAPRTPEVIEADQNQSWRYRFRLAVPKAAILARRPLAVEVRCAAAGVPAEVDFGSEDRRELGFAVTNVSLIQE